MHKSRKPFFPTLPSTKSHIKSSLHFQGPKHILANVSHELGGLESACSAGELPQNEHQIAYIKSKVKACDVSLSSVQAADQVFAMMQSAKLNDSLGPFVREIRPSPEPAFILARDRQLNDLVRFCAAPNSFSILTVDPTFNLGEFNVTPTTYRHCLLISARSDKPPVMIGSVMIHYHKTFHTYLFFASTLIGL